MAGERLGPGLGAAGAALVAGASVFVALLDEVEAKGPTAIDRHAFGAASALQSEGAVDVAREVTVLGSIAVVGPLTALAVALLLWRRRLVEAAVLVAGLGLLQLFWPIKALVDRPRPADPEIAVEGLSFPSGHATQAVMWIAIALAVGSALPSRAARRALVVAASLLAVVVGLSRVQLRVHYLTDVLAGWALGTALVALCALTALLLARARRPRTPHGRHPDEPGARRARAARIAR